MSEHASEPGPENDKQDPKAAKIDQEAARAKQDKARAEAEAAQDEQRAEKVEEKAKEAEEADEDAEGAGAAAAAGSKDAGKAAPKKAAGKSAKATPKKAAAEEADDDEKLEVVDKPVVPKIKPELDQELTDALAARSDKKAKTPRFRRHEWWRYKKLGGKNAPWRRPRGIHSKQRRHFKYRPPVVSIGYRGPREARGLHPSGFEEVLVYRPEDLTDIDPKIQAARVGGTVGGRKAELIEAEADKRGIRVLNRRSS